MLSAASLIYYKKENRWVQQSLAAFLDAHQVACLLREDRLSVGRYDLFKFLDPDGRLMDRLFLPVFGRKEEKKEKNDDFFAEEGFGSMVREAKGGYGIFRGEDPTTLFEPTKNPQKIKRQGVLYSFGLYSDQELAFNALYNHLQGTLEEKKRCKCPPFFEKKPDTY